MSNRLDISYKQGGNCLFVMKKGTGEISVRMPQLDSKKNMRPNIYFMIDCKRCLVL